MDTFETVLLVLLVIDALALGGLVLLQQGKGADIGAAFGSGGSNTMFGGAGSASFLTKLTVWLAIGYFLVSFGLAYYAKERAAAMGTLGIPGLTVPADDGDGIAELPEESPEESGGASSDIPDV